MTTALSDSGVLFADGNTQVYPNVAVRQTVLSGPVDTNGFSAFGGATGGTTVTAAGTLIATAANGATNRTGSKLNPSWTGLSTNGTMYNYFDTNTDGTLTEGSGTLPPIYQWGGTPSVVAGQFTFNIQEMKGYIGNGATAPAGYRVYVGEVTVAGGVVTGGSIVWYALQGRYLSALTVLPAVGTALTFNHLIGWPPEMLRQEHTLQFTAAVSGYSIGDKLQSLFTQGASGTSGEDCRGNMTRLAGTVIGDVNGSYIVKNKSNGGAGGITGASASVYASFVRTI